MAIRNEKIIYISCDILGCKNKLQGHTVPPDWRYIQILIPGAGGKCQVKGIMCPECSQEMLNDLDPICIRKDETDGTGRSETDMSTVREQA